MQKLNPVLRRGLAWLPCSVLFIGGLIIGIQAIKDFNKATIVIEWTTASELETIGFNLLRGETEEGPFTQINAQTIPPSSDPLAGSEYSYEDTGLKAGKTYYYVLEEIVTSGSTNRHGPIVQEAANSNWMNLLLAILILACGGLCVWLTLSSPKGQNI